MKADAATTLHARMHDRMRRIHICSRRLSTGSFQGGVQSRFRGRGMDFDEVREYAPGDDVRAIDWNATARTGRTFVKKYREERQLTIFFLVDMSASGALGAGESTKREQAIEIAGVLALAALRSDHRVGLALFTDDVEGFTPPARGRSHALRVVSKLVAFQPKGRGTNLTAALRTVRERLRRRTVIVVLSDFLLDAKGLDESLVELRALARRHDVVTIRTGDAHDRQLPAVGLVTLEDAETGEVVEVDTGNAKQRARLEEAVRETEERIRALSRSALMNEDIRDIRAPIVIPAWWHWPLAIVVAALLSVAIVLLVRAWQKRRAAKLTPLERARQALLAAEEHARAGRANEWADIVAETLRGALASRLGADVLRQNTSELAKSPWAQPPPSEANAVAAETTVHLIEAPQIIALLGTCDLARFALASLDVEALLTETAVARDLAEKLLSPPPKPRTPPLRAVPVTP